MHDEEIDILLIEDCITDAELVTHMLQTSSSLRCKVKTVATLQEATFNLRSQQFDLILADLCLPDSDGFETLSELRQVTNLTPIIAITGLDDDELGIAAIRAGANDYVPKNQLNESLLSRAIVHTIFRIKSMRDANTELASKNERLKRMYNISQQFVDNVSHEFRTPLTVIREFAAIVRDGIDGPVTDKQVARLSTLIKRTDDLAMMVDDLLDTSRLKAGLLKTCRRTHKLSEIISHVERMLAQRALSKQISLSIVDVREDLEVYCDQEKVRRILINLIVNAIKFTPVSGKIEVTATLADADRIVITVSDNGEGIPADDLQRIFERFQQVEAHHRMASCKGFGLGLNIARALASLNLGSLQVSSKEGQGSKFSVLLPIAKVDSILRCYLDQRAATQDEPNHISVVEVRPVNVEPNSNVESLDTLDEFLRSTVKTFDIVLRTHDDAWLIYACNSEVNLPCFFERMNEEWAKLKRNHYGAPLPVLDYKHIFTGDAEKDREKLIQVGCPEEVQTRIAHPTPSIELARNKRILVIEDEIEVSNAIESRLTASGFTVTTAFDGPQGLRSIEESLPDAILLDIRMPGMDGLAVLRQLKSQQSTSETPVIVLSASLQDQQTALDRGAHFFIQKPFRSESIMSAINSALQTENTTTPSEPTTN